MLTTYAGDVQVLRALKAGARGYLLKNSLHKELLETIRSVHAGKRALSTEASMQLAEHATDDALTPAEIRVLRLIAEGNANKEKSTRNLETSGFLRFSRRSDSVTEILQSRDRGTVS